MRILSGIDEIHVISAHVEVGGEIWPPCSALWLPYMVPNHACCAQTCHLAYSLTLHASSWIQSSWIFVN